MALEWRARTPAPPARRRRTGARPTCTTKAWSPWPARGALGRRVRPRPPGRRARDHPGRRPAADRRRPRARPPAAPTLEASGRRRGPGMAGPADRPGDHRPHREAALFADQLIAATPRRIGQVQAARLVQEARLYFDPDRALADEEEALARRGVWLRHGGAPATTDITMTLDTPDALLFDQTLTRIASDLRDLGDTEDLEVRRARAVGSSPTPSTPWTCWRPRRRSTQPPQRAANLYVHLTPQTSPPTSMRAPVPPRSRSSAPPPPGCSPTGSPASRQPAPRSPSAPSSTSPRPGRGPARPTRSDARNRGAARRPLRLPRLPSRLPGLRPRPHHRIPTHGGRRTTGPNPARQSRTPVPRPSPREDPYRLALQTPRRRQLRVDRAHRAPVPRHACLASYGPGLV